MSLIISRISRVSIDVGLLTSIDTGTVMRRPAGDPRHSCETVRHWVVQRESKPSLDPPGLSIYCHRAKRLAKLQTRWPYVAFRRSVIFVKRRMLLYLSHKSYWVCNEVHKHPCLVEFRWI